MTQGRRQARCAATVWLVRAALSLVVSVLLVALSSGQPTAGTPKSEPEPADPFPGIPEGPPFAPSLSLDLLRFVRDHQGMPTVSPDVVNPQAEREFDAFLEAVKNARQTTIDGFVNTVKPEITIGHVLAAPRKFRGTVIKVEGNLRRVRSFEAPAMLRQAGVEMLYEAWLFNRDRYGAQPICLLFTNLPEELPVEDRLQNPPAVTFAGYFFKIYRYEAADPNRPLRDAPLLIGHAPTLVDQPRESATQSFWQPLIAGVLGVIAVALLTAFSLAWWTSRNDRKISQQLAGNSAQRFIDEAEKGPGTFPDPNLN